MTSGNLSCRWSQGSVFGAPWTGSVFRAPGTVTNMLLLALVLDEGTSRSSRLFRGVHNITKGATCAGLVCPGADYPFVLSREVGQDKHKLCESLLLNLLFRDAYCSCTSLDNNIDGSCLFPRYTRPINRRKKKAMFGCW